MPKRTKEEALAYKSLSKEERKALRKERVEKRKETKKN